MKLNDRLVLLQQPYYPPAVPLCSHHHLPKQSLCLASNCPLLYQLQCSDCLPCPPSHQTSLLKIVPKLAQWLLAEWEEAQQHHKSVQRQWKVCLNNIDYCFSILAEVKKQIQARKYELPILTAITESVTEMFRKTSTDSLTLAFKNLNKKYSLFDTVEASGQASVQCQQTRREQQQKLKQSKSGSLKTKLFSEKALLFSEGLCSLMEDRLGEERHGKALTEARLQHIYRLRDLKGEQKQKLEKVESLSLEVCEGKELEEVLKGCSNLHSLQLAHKGKGLGGEDWSQVIRSLEDFKFLRELVLTLHRQHLPLLTKVFKANSKAVRQVDTLAVQITDQSELNGKELAAFCNSLQLRALRLTIPRNNMKSESLGALLEHLRMHTTMSQLPMKLLHINAAKNKVPPHEEATLSKLFAEKAKDVQDRQLQV